tara:strand:+ start:758 stop:946 length:189 start_codon:yes stop_codon:yes gene_type:complete
MSERQKFLDTVRDLQTDLKVVLDKGKFVKEVEKFQVKEALVNLSYAEKHLHGFLQVDKERGN